MEEDPGRDWPSSDVSDDAAHRLPQQAGPMHSLGLLCDSILGTRMLFAAAWRQRAEGWTPPASCQLPFPQFRCTCWAPPRVPCVHAMLAGACMVAGCGCCTPLARRGGCPFCMAHPRHPHHTHAHPCGTHAAPLRPQGPSNGPPGLRRRARRAPRRPRRGGAAGCAARWSDAGHRQAGSGPRIFQLEPGGGARAAAGRVCCGSAPLSIVPAASLAGRRRRARLRVGRLHACGLLLTHASNARAQVHTTPRARCRCWPWRRAGSSLRACCACRCRSSSPPRGFFLFQRATTGDSRCC